MNGPDRKVNYWAGCPPRGNYQGTILRAESAANGVPGGEKDGGGRMRRAREGSLWLVAFQVAKERVHGKRKEYRAKSGGAWVNGGRGRGCTVGREKREGCSSPIIGKLKAVTHLGTTSIRLSLGPGPRSILLSI